MSVRTPPLPAGVVSVDAVAAMLAETADPTPVVAAPDWTAALCAQADPEAWFPDRGVTAWSTKRICRRCELRTACLAWALATNQRHGVWGGLSDQERQRLRHRLAGGGGVDG